MGWEHLSHEKNMSCGMGEIVGERRDGMGTTADGGTGKIGYTHYDGTGNSRDGNKMP